MKVLFVTLLVIVFYSCSKTSAESTNSYSTVYGEYNSLSGDTITVRQGASENTIWMRFAYKNPVALRAIFDSVKINPDLTFTINEHSVRNDNPNWPITVVGGGVFGTNTVAINFSVGAGLLVFNCVKK